MRQKITTFLMFEGKAEEAMNFYLSLSKDSSVTSITRYWPEGPGKEGSVMHAIFALQGQYFMCIDSNVTHGFTFTPAMSLFVDCTTKDEIDGLFSSLSQVGQVLMPLDAYPFSPLYAWVNDRFGVSWQLSLQQA
jgi:predicted 3-demethylubiquinone-9 3-methyltransferase (glyoxalase superfamily)